MSADPSATATADPLDDPPGSRAGSSGLTGVPNHWLTPEAPNASSCRLALPTMAAPDARAPAMQAASRAAGAAVSASALQPAVVGTPAMSMTSFTAIRGPLPGQSSRLINVDTGPLSPCDTGPHAEPVSVKLMGSPSHRMHWHPRAPACLLAPGPGAGMLVPGPLAKRWASRVGEG